MAGKIEVEVRTPFATVTIANSERLNALTSSMWRELGLTFSSLGKDETLRCIVIQGEGDLAFAAGADISEFAEARGTLNQVASYHEDLVPAALDAIADCNCPVIAGLRGACIGGGLEIASVCDLRISATSAQFGIPVGLLGFPVAYRELDYLFRIAGRSALTELLLEGRIYNSSEAFQKGIVTRVVPDKELDNELQSTMDRIARGSPLAARTHKEQIRRISRKEDLPTLEERMKIYQFANSEDYRIGREAFLAKRKPVFVGR
jgi:enoyl-CoA hydratase